MSTETLTAPAEVQARLLVPRDQALKSLKAQLEKGLALRQTRLRSASDLEKAREIKQEWSNLTSTLLNQMLDNEEVTQQCNNWVGKILPEFAGLTQFVERFYEEMDFRLKALHGVMKKIAAGHFPPADSSQQGPAESIEMFEMPASPNLVEAAAAAVESIQHVQEEVVVQPRSETKIVAQVAPPPKPSSTNKQKLGKRVTLIVHARNEQIESSVGQFVLALGFEPIAIYSQVPGKQHEGIEKLSDHGESAFAIILASDDDVAIARNANNTPLQHAHRSSAYELGYCVGKLGVNRVCVLHTSDDGLFRDEYGILYVPVDPAEGWTLQLARHFRLAGVEVDLNRLC